MRISASRLYDDGPYSVAVPKFTQLVLTNTPIQGCGRGYDVIALSLHGFDAYGLEISSTAVSEAQALAQTELASPSAEDFGAHTNGLSLLHGHDVQNPTTSFSSGTPRFLQGDFFDSSWSDALGFQFDVVYDYTVCIYAWLQRSVFLLLSLGTKHPSPVDGLMMLTRGRGLVSVCSASESAGTLGRADERLTEARWAVGLLGVSDVQGSWAARASLGSEWGTLGASCWWGCGSRGLYEETVRAAGEDV
jgi:hypothetical protein